MKSEMSAFISVLLMSLLVVSDRCSGGRFERSINRSYRSLLQVHNGMRWGSWGLKEMCPAGMYTAGFSLKDLCDLRKLQLQFSEPVKRQQTQDKKLFKDDKIGSLIFRAEQMLNSSSLGLCEPVTEHNNNDSGDMEDSLDADRSWENPPVTFKSPVTVGGADEQSQYEEQQRNLSSASGSSGYSSRKHPGPVEALKHMLLRLQAVEHNINQSNTSDTQREEEEQLDREENDLNRSGESLQRVLHHVDRLKTLVDVMNEKKDEPHRETCS